MHTHPHLRRLVLILSLLVLVGSACKGDPSGAAAGGQQGTLSISGAFALYPMMTRWAEEYQKLNPQVEFDISAGGAGKGMADALAGAVDIGMVSRDISADEQAKGAFWVPVTKDAVFPVVNAQNPVAKELIAKGLTRQAFIGIFITGEIKSWGQVIGKPEVTDEIHVYTRSDACGAAETWANYLGKKQENLLGIGVFGDPGLMDAVVKDPLGIGYNNLGYAYDNSTGSPIAGALVLPIDVDENGQAGPEEFFETKAAAIEAVATGKYPSPPARVLNLVTRGKPAGLINHFIQWILTDGQSFVDEAGYIQLTSDQLTTGLEKLR